MKTPTEAVSGGAEYQSTGTRTHPAFTQSVRAGWPVRAHVAKLVDAGDLEAPGPFPGAV